MSLLKRFKPQAFAAHDDLLCFGSDGQRALPKTLRCLVWNMYKAKRREWWIDFQHLTADRELVLLQEAVANAPTDSMFFYSQRHRWLMARSHQNPRSGVTTGVKTGCIAAPTHAKTFLSPHSEPLLDTQKAMLSTSYAIENSDQQLRVLNLHAINFVKVAKFRAHVNQIGEAMDSHLGPILVAGDFNTWRRKRRLHFEALARELGLSQTHWPRRKQLQHFNQHLDHVYFRDMLPVHAESLQHIRSSDHKPIAVTFRL